VGAREAIAVVAGPLALLLALQAIGLRAGDEVIVGADAPTTTGAATVLAGARPVRADVLPDTLTLDPQDAARRVTARTRAVMPSHFAGHPAEMDRLLALAARHRLHVIEDASGALGATYRGRRIGSVGELTVFGFGPDQPIAVEEGAVLTTEDAGHARRIRARLAAPGEDLAMAEATAAQAFGHLVAIEQRLGVHAYYAGLYQHGLSDLPELRLPEPRAGVQPAWALYVLRLDLARLTLDRDRFIAALVRRGVRADAPFPPEILAEAGASYPRARQAAETALSLPLDPRMREAEVWEVIGAVREVVFDHRRPGPPRLTR
jgi:perosamine synthetase